MKTKVCILAVASALFFMASSTEKGMMLMHSEAEYADTLAFSLYNAISSPGANVDEGIAVSDNKPMKVAGRTVFIHYDTLGDIGWPTVVNGVTITFVHEDGSRSKPYQYRI